MNATSKVTKTYFHFNTKEFDLPYDFMASKNERYIVVQYVAATYKNYLTGDIMFHSDIVQRDGYLDDFIMLANKRQTKYRKFSFMNTSKRTYRCWFTDIAGNEIEPEAFVVSCLLIY